VRAAESSRSPFIILLFPSTLKQLPSLVYAARAAADSAQVPISVHVDHAQDEAQIRYMAEKLPLDSIMVDMSHYDEAENLEKTRVLGAICHTHGIAVEAESGRIEGGEDGIADTGDLEGMLLIMHMY
jgi:fructose-bisphosphate aldolase class II